MTEKLIVIPARIGSKRFPKKMLFKIQGKTLIEWTIEAAKKTTGAVLTVDGGNIAASLR